jgi:hypothetical protein
MLATNLIEADPMSAALDGFYAAYLSSKVGQGFAMLVLRKGRVVGSDTNGVQLDGQYADAENNQISIALSVKIPPSTPLLQGGMSGPQGESYDVTFQISHNIEEQEVIRIETKRGPVNLKLIKLRGLDD